MAAREKVFIAKVPGGYEDRAAIAAAVARGLDELGYAPPARLVAKANWVLAHDRVASACYTRPELLCGALEAILGRNADARISFTGNSGTGVPTRVVARRARGRAPEFERRGAFELERMFPGRVAIEPTDASKVRRYRLSIGEALTDAERAAAAETAASADPRKRYWREVKTSASFLDAEGVIFFPKVKSNVLSHGVTGAIKLQGIGLLLDEDRMDGHNYHNHRRIVDMLEVAEPDLIVTDGIEMALGGDQMTERGYPLGVIVMATNPVAHDATIARILGLHPEKVDHIRIAHERGYGPIWASDIEVVGDARVGELNARVRSFGDTGFIPVVDFPKKFERETRREFPLEVLGEPPWDVAGSHGLLLDWLYMTYDFRELRAYMANWPSGSILVGGFREAPPAPAHDRVYLVGDAAIAAWRKLGWAAWGVTIPGFVWRRMRGPRRIERYTRPDGRRGVAILIPGDPPTHRDMIVGFLFGTLGKLWAPLFRADLFADSYFRMLGTTLRRWWRNRGGIETVEAGAIERLRARKAARAAAALAAPPPEEKPQQQPSPPPSPSEKAPEAPEAEPSRVA